MNQSIFHNQPLARVREFWEQNVCGEHYSSDEPQGSETYFATIVKERYRWHYHLPAFLDEVTRYGVSVLEVGCGMGIDSAELAKRGMKVTAVDLTETGIFLAKQNFRRLGLRGDLQVGNAEALPFTANIFDCVYSFGALHHTPNVEQAIREVWRVLKPNGYAFLMLYSRYSLNFYVHKIFNRPFEYAKNPALDAPVTRAYSQRELQRLFSDFVECAFRKRYLFGAGYKPIASLIPTFLNDWMGKRVGWHWLIRARKAQETKKSDSLQTWGVSPVDEKGASER